jgi:iron-only hydrogenase group A
MADNTVQIRIDGRSCQVKAGITLLEACRNNGTDIPTLCFLEGINEEAACSLCLVEVAGARTLLRACVTRVREGMEVVTVSERVRQARRVNMELLLAGHPKDCFVCGRNQDCELRRLAHDMGIRTVRFPKAVEAACQVDASSPAIIRDPSKCVLCRRCLSVCRVVQEVNAIDAVGRGKNTKISTFGDKGLGHVACINCGQCLLVCPTGALTEQSAVEPVWKALADPKKIVMVETAPAVRAAIGEEFGLEPGTLVTGKMVAALRKAGFDKVFDTQFSADLTIMEEGFELIHRIQNKGVLPLITSCSPGWIKFAEHFYPRVLDHLSSCKSPQQMFGAVAKTYYAEKLNVDPRDIVVVSVMPCVAKKFEAARPEMNSAFHYWKGKLGLKEKDSFPDVDHVLTTREAARLIREAGIDLARLDDEKFDDPLGASSGAAVIFGATGGVMEAAVRTAYEVLTKNPLPRIDFEEVRGLEGIKTAELDINGLKVKVAVAHSLANARVLMEEIQAGVSPYAFIEIMTCPGGCIGGGGQPLPTNTEIRKKRIEAIYFEDARMPIRKSHENPAVAALYKDFLEKPLGERSHHLLHTSYVKRG